MTESTYGLLSDPNDPRHGTATAYSYHNCRCDPCKAANAAAQKTARERRRQGRIPPAVHGTRNGYDNWLCRCDPCKNANAQKGNTPE